MLVALTVVVLLTCLGGAAQAKEVKPPPARQYVGIRDGLPDGWPELCAPGSVDIRSNPDCSWKSQAARQCPHWQPQAWWLSMAAPVGDR